MKNIVIFGAAGHTGRYITQKMLELENVQVSAFVRNPEKLEPQLQKQLRVIQGDALNPEDVKKAMHGQDILLCSLEGDVLTMAKNIVDALDGSGVSRIIWITGMGIHGEITGLRGQKLALLAKTRPEYIQAADLIAACPAVTTLLRCPKIEDGDETLYYLTPEGIQPRKKSIMRASIAQCMADMIEDETLGRNASLGITN